MSDEQRRMNRLLNIEAAAKEVALVAKHSSAGGELRRAIQILEQALEPAEQAGEAGTV